MIFIILVSTYSALIIILLIGFLSLNRFPEPKEPFTNRISILVAIRNEASNIRRLLKDLSSLDYPKNKFEVIVVDDHSSDHPDLSGYNLDVHYHRATSHGKKGAITLGVSQAKNDIIVTTDADCHVPPAWLTEINKGFQDPNVKMLVGGVRFSQNDGFFSKLQALEFVSVQVTGAGSLGLGFPTMANGANLAYRKEEFVKINGYQGSEHISSGDDEFLLNNFDRKSVRYLYSGDALVTSSPHHLLTSFVSQRLRWAGKWKSNISVSTRIFAVVVWLFHLGFFLMPFSAITGFISWKLLFILAAAKAFVEALLLIPAAGFYRVKWSWISFLVLQFVYSFYVIYVGFMSQVLSPEWKGRAVETKV